MKMEKRLLVVSLFLLLISVCIQIGCGQSSVEIPREETPREQQEIIEPEPEEAKDSSEPDDEGDVDNEGISRPRRRRNTEGNEVLLSRADDGLQISMVNSPGDTHRIKRTTFNISKYMWPHRIPYLVIFSEDIERRTRLQRVMDDIEDRLCVHFVDIGGRIDKSDNNWPSKHGFKTNAYIKFEIKEGCVSNFGQGSGKGPVSVSPCNGYVIMMHETMHALGAIHAHMAPKRDKYITVHEGNIESIWLPQYKIITNGKETYSSYFDSASSVLYTRNTFTKQKNVKPSYDFLRPDMGELVGMSESTKTLFYEMNTNYKCRERFCSGVSKDCGAGYLTFVRQKCVCVCPDQYDPDTGCTTLIDKVEGPKTWPNVPFTMYKADECPTGFSEGTIPIPTYRTPYQTGVPLPTKGTTLNIHVCTKTTPTDNIAWTDWPMGSVCVGKVKGVPCGLPFVESTYMIKTTRPKPLKGSVGDVSTHGKYVVIKFCCHDKPPITLPIKLPTATAFRLLKTKAGCQEVEDMSTVETLIGLYTTASVTGYLPYYQNYNKYFYHKSCLYIPPVYGCNKIFRLSSSERTATFSIPNNGATRESNRRCFYAFEAPPKSRLRLTFNKFSIHPKDKFYVKRFHAWTNPYRVMSNSRPTQIITERNYLFVEFWSYYEEESRYEGADLTVDLLLDDEMCYNADLQGSDYAGDKTVTELYEECLPWKDAVNCRDFPWKYSLTLLNSGNKCRNLVEVEMLQPWCYIKMDGVECSRRYCDVCNEADPKDVKEDCGDKIQADPNACSDIGFRNNCFKSCGASTTPYDSSKVKCPKPQLQAPCTLKESPQNSYDVGSTVDVSCGKHTTQLKCTTHGWGPFDDKIADRSCIDRSQLCENALRNFPKFCTHTKSKEIAEKLCKKSCSVCK